MQELMGHKSIQMTVRYSHLTPKHTLAAVKRLAGIVSATPTDTRTSTGPEEQIPPWGASCSLSHFSVRCCEGAGP